MFAFRQDSPNSYTLAQEIATELGAKTMGYDARANRILVPTAESGAMKLLVFALK